MQAVETARHEHQRLTPAREQGGQRMRAIGHADHCVDLARGVRRHGTLMARDMQEQSDTMRAIAPHERLRERCLDRLEKAERVVPTMPATIACVSG
jgi:hypothetical protein